MILTLSTPLVQQLMSICLENVYKTVLYNINTVRFGAYDLLLGTPQPLCQYKHQKKEKTNGTTIEIYCVLCKTFSMKTMKYISGKEKLILQALKVSSWP